VSAMGGTRTRNELLTALDVVRRSAAFLAEKGVENPRLNAEWLVARALGLDRMQLYLQFDRPVSEQERASLRKSVSRRARREPLQYILGEAAFGELSLKADPRALIPRPETEQLVELVQTDLPETGAAYRLLDLGTGSGPIALALAFAYPQADVVAAERDPAALELAGENAFRCGLQTRVRFVQSDWFAGLDPGEGPFDLVAANPPYLTREEFEQAAPEVREREPAAALVAADKGLADLGTIVREAPRWLKPGGVLWLETGIAHREPLLALCREAGFREAEGRDDWSGRPRFVRARRQLGVVMAGKGFFAAPPDGQGLA